MKVYPLAVGEILDFGRDWAKWLGTDTISASTWTVDAGLPVVSQGYDTTSTSLFVDGAGLTVGTKFKCKNQITTAAGRKPVRAFYIEIVADKFE